MIIFDFRYEDQRALAEEQDCLSLCTHRVRPSGKVPEVTFKFYSPQK